MADRSGIEWTDSAWTDDRGRVRIYARRDQNRGPGQQLRREMLRFFGLRWCRGCAAWLIAEAVLSQGVCQACANAEYRALYARDGRAIRARVYARKRAVEPLPIDAQEILLEWFEGLCAYCDSPATTWDHIILVRDGGRTVPGNVAPACNSCNSSKKCADVFDWCERTGRDPSRVLDVTPAQRGGRLMGTKIEWTDETWNPVTGCTEVSPGCDHCYAKTFAERWRGTAGHYFERGFDVQLRPDKLQPLRWRRPRRIFVNSMSDLFHHDIPDEYIARVFAVMAYAHWHTFQILTKRHARMRALLSSGAFLELFDREFCKVPDWNNRYPDLDFARKNTHLIDGPLGNVWLGVSAENQQWADIRIPALLDTPAVVRFASLEPLLGPIDLVGRMCATCEADMEAPQCNLCYRRWWLRPGRENRIDWVIVGGESGRGARRMEWDWAASLRDQCAVAGVAFHFKQSGSVLAREWGYGGKGGDPIEWPDWRGGWPREYPEAVTA